VAQARVPVPLAGEMKKIGFALTLYSAKQKILTKDWFGNKLCTGKLDPTTKGFIAGGSG
jgi:hypothetical protein